jgi:hypothetical protein
MLLCALDLYALRLVILVEAVGDIAILSSGRRVAFDVFYG